MEITINGQRVPVVDETTVLEVAQREGIWIPTLCHHPGLPPYGACRLCVVEIKAGGRPGLTASCALPVSDGLVIETDSARVQQRRRVLAQLLLAATPDSTQVQELAGRLGVTSTPFVRPADQKGNCILCGLCVRVCNQVGGQAIGFAFRGSRRRVTPPFGKPAADCLGCQACAQICPTNEIRFTESGDRLFGENWKAALPLARCISCGRLFTPERLFEHVQGKLGAAYRGDCLCPTCMRKATARVLADSHRKG